MKWKADRAERKQKEAEERIKQDKKATRLVARIKPLMDPPFCLTGFRAGNNRPAKACK